MIKIGILIGGLWTIICGFIIIFANLVGVVGAIIGIIILGYSILKKLEVADKMPHIQFKISLDNFQIGEIIKTYSPIMIKNTGKNDANGIKVHIEWGKENGILSHYCRRIVQNLNPFLNIKFVMLELIDNKLLLPKLGEIPKKELIKTKTSLLPEKEMEIDLNTILDKIPEGAKFNCEIIYSDDYFFGNYCTKISINKRKKINTVITQLDLYIDSCIYGKKPFYGVDYIFEKDEILKPSEFIETESVIELDI